MDKFLKIIDKIVIVFASILLIILIGCISVLPIAKSKAFYMKEHKKNNVVEILNTYTFTGESHYQKDEEGNLIKHYYPDYDVNMEIVEIATEHIIDYLYHKNVDSMQFQIDTPEGKIDFFTTQAIVHMKDVKVLFIGGINLAFISLALFICSIIYLIFRRQFVKKSIIKLYSITIISFIILLIGLIIFAIIDFDTAFTVFHYMIFSSSDAELAISFHYYDTLTNVLTGEFFMHIGLIIGITFVSLLALSVIIGKILEKHGNTILNKLLKKQTA